MSIKSPVALFVCVLGVAIGLWTPRTAHAQTVSVTFDRGFVSVSAHGALLREVLDRWAEVGRTAIVNSDQLQPTAVTLDLVHVPESEALGILLRSLPGYLLAGRSATRPDQSSIDRIVLVASRPTQPPSAPATSLVAPPAPVPQSAGPAARLLLPDPEEVNRDGLVIIGGPTPSVGASPAAPTTTAASPGGPASLPGAAPRTSTTTTGRPGEVAPVTQQPPVRPPLQRTHDGETPPAGGFQAPVAASGAR